MRHLLFGAISLALASTASLAADLPTVKDLPPGTVQLSPVIPGMGEHWANPKDLPLGPIYCVYEGQVICLEFMISQEDLAAGKSWPELRGMDGLPPIDHMDVGFEPQGHEGYEIPHYDIHLYFIGKDELKKIK